MFERNAGQLQRRISQSFDLRSVQEVASSISKISQEADPTLNSTRTEKFVVSHIGILHTLQVDARRLNRPTLTVDAVWTLIDLIG